MFRKSIFKNMEYIKVILLLCNGIIKKLTFVSVNICKNYIIPQKTV